MAFTSSIKVRTTSTLTSQTSSTTSTSPKPPSSLPLPSRRQCLLLLISTPLLKLFELPAKAQDIPLFGLRKKLKKVEEEAEEIVKEGFEVADKGIEAAEKGIVAAEEGILVGEKEVETVVSFGGFQQAGVVAAAEVAGVVIATSVVNGILGPENQKI